MSDIRLGCSLPAMASSQSTELTATRQGTSQRDVNQLSDDELRHIVQAMTSATRMRMHRILTEYVTLDRCQQPCGNPDCGRLCNRRIRLDRSDEHVHHFCKACHRAGW